MLLVWASDADCDLWVGSRGSLTENDQQFGGWMRAPPTINKKCSIVRVERSEGDTKGEGAAVFS